MSSFNLLKGTVGSQEYHYAGKAMKMIIDQSTAHTEQQQQIQKGRILIFSTCSVVQSIAETCFKAFSEMAKNEQFGQNIE